MTFMVCFTVEGTPHSKGRPRFRRFGNFVQTYTDAKTKSYESIVKDAAKQAMGSSPPLETPIKLDLIIKLPVPKSYPKKRTEACLNGSEWPMKADIDNYCKSLMDGMNGIVYLDDSQVVILRAVKTYDREAGIEVQVTEVLE